MAVDKPENNEQISADILQRKKTVLRANDIIPSGSESNRQQKSEIPRFDLAEDIMAEHRKITAVKRKAPADKKTQSQNQQRKAKSTDYTVEQPTLTAREQKQIIAEIVARDIERLCRTDK